MVFSYCCYQNFPCFLDSIFARIVYFQWYILSVMFSCLFLTGLHLMFCLPLSSFSYRFPTQNVYLLQFTYIQAKLQKYIYLLPMVAQNIHSFIHSTQLSARASWLVSTFFSISVSNDSENSVSKFSNDTHIHVMSVCM